MEHRNTPVVHQRFRGGKVRIGSEGFEHRLGRSHHYIRRLRAPAAQPATQSEIDSLLQAAPGHKHPLIRVREVEQILDVQHLPDRAKKESEIRPGE